MIDNPFLHPRKIRKIILKNVQIPSKLKLNGKGFICALINSRCHIGCSHCMFSSNMDEKKNDSNTMTPKRIDKLMELVKDSNTGYLLVSGGGEGFLEPSLMYQIIEKSSADLTWMVTSAFWAKNKLQALDTLDYMYKAYLKGCMANTKRRICVRVSFDIYHINKLSKDTQKPLDYIINIIKIFESTYAHQNNFFLQLHSIEGEEKLIEQLQEEISGKIFKDTSSIHNNEKATESSVMLKLASGYSFEITFAKLLLSDTTVDLKDEKLLKERVFLWERDAFINEQDKPAYQINSDGSLGTDMLIIYNGRVAGGWQCELSDVSINLDKDSYVDIINKTFSDVGVLATMENGLKYRFNIIDEVCPKASLRAKAVNIRDYTSPILFEEDIIKAYYSIRVIQDFFNIGRINQNEIENYPPRLKELITMKKEELQFLYHSSKYDIIQQFKETEKDFPIFLEEIRIFSKTKNSKQFIQNILEKIGNNLYNFDKWRVLLKRISNKWYDISSLNSQELAILKEVEQLIELEILNGRRVYDGLL